jgi:hypothetical protein
MYDYNKCIYRTATLQGQEVFFEADSMEHARTLAAELAGTAHRGIAVILPTNPAWKRGLTSLGY